MAASLKRIPGLLCGGLAALFVFLSTGCDPFDIRDILNGDQGVALAISPASVELRAGGSATFAATGGVAPYVFTVVAGGSGTIDPNTGAFVAPNTGGTTTVRVTDATGTTADAMVTTLDVDYAVLSVTNTGATTAGGSLGGSLTVQNAGTRDGTQAVAWSVYLSADTALDTAADALVDAGTIPTPGLAAGTTLSVAFDGVWLASIVPQDWYLFAVVDAGDDLVTTNDTGVSAVVTVDPPDVDYAVTVGAVTGTTAGQAFSASFSIQNNGVSGGSYAIVWAAYLSPDINLDTAADTLIATDSELALGPAPAFTTVPLAGTWPQAGTYYVIAAVSAQDDLSGGNDVDPSAPITVDPPDVDYAVTVGAVTGRTAGQALSASFTVQNNGTAAGASPIVWAAYLSPDAFPDPDTDQVIASGSLVALGAGQSSGSVGLAGTWPALAAPTVYYLVVVVNAQDDTDNSNDYDDAGALTVGPPDYSVLNPTVVAEGLPNTALGAGYSFEILNTGIGDGVSDVTWSVYASLDGTIGIGDTLIATGSSAAPTAGTSTATIPFGGTWPAFPSYYRLIVVLDSPEDPVAANDTWASGAIEVPLVFDESALDPGDANDDDTYPFDTPGQLGDYGITIDPNMLVRFDGVMDGPDCDTLVWTAAAGVTSVEMLATWVTGVNEIDLDFWTTGGTLSQSTDLAADREPGVGVFTRTVAAGLYYTSVDFVTSASTGAYRLYIHGRP